MNRIGGSDYLIGLDQCVVDWSSCVTAVDTHTHTHTHVRTHRHTHTHTTLSLPQGQPLHVSPGVYQQEQIKQEVVEQVWRTLHYITSLSSLTLAPGPRALCGCSPSSATRM